jgi:hypothetical protein
MRFNVRWVLMVVYFSYMQVSRYHKFLRVSLLLTAVTLLFDGGFVFPITEQLSDNTLSYLAGARASVLATVPENEINTLTAQISERQRELDLREAALREREIATRNFGGESPVDYSTYILSTILFILTVLIVLNYAMDWTRVRKSTYEESMG